MVTAVARRGGAPVARETTPTSDYAHHIAVRRLVLAAPRGFCAGVVRAVGMVEAALAEYGAPVYVRRAIVHNPHVVARLEAMGAVVVREVEQVPEGSAVVFSAHGVAQAVRDSAVARGLRIVDATCPLVRKVHDEALRFLRDGYEVVLLGHPGHDEVTGTLGQAASGIYLAETVADVARLQLRDPERVACVTQTTLTPGDVAPVVRALRARFPNLAQLGSDDICYATHQRQVAVRRLAAQADVVLVLGDATSSNSHRLREVALGAGLPAYLIGTIAELQPEWLAGATTVGLTAGASTPEWVVQEAVAYFARLGTSVSEGGDSGERKARWESVA